MPQRSLIRSWLFLGLRWLAIAAVVVALPLLAYGGLQDCRGGRLVVAIQEGSDVEARIELVSSRQRALIWGPAYRVHPERVFFSNEIEDSRFIVTVTNRRTDEVATYEYGQVSRKGGTYYFIVGETDVIFSSTFAGYFQDPYLPAWLNAVIGGLYTLSDALTCTV